MQARRVKILGTGSYLPKQRVSAEDLERRLGLEPGWVAAKSGVMTRYFVADETASQMGARAAEAALKAAGLRFEDIDCVVCASGSPEQVIPCTAALLQKALGHERSGTPCFDVNSTCLSFITALDLLSYMVDAGRYERVLLVSSEIASVALDWREKESATIFGDGAAAVVLGRSAERDGSRILCSRQETYSSGADMTQLRGGGTRHHPRGHDGDLASYTERYCLFEMDGKAVFKLSANVLPGFLQRMLEPAGLKLADLQLIVPHQASMMALGLIQRRLGIPDEKWMVTAPEVGNTIAASVPLALHAAIERGRVRRGDRVMLLGTSAGFSCGALVLDY